MIIARIFKELAWGKHKCKNRCKTAMPLEDFELIAAFQEGNNIYMHTLFLKKIRFCLITTKQGHGL